MRLAKLLSLLLTFAVFLGTAMAADDATSAAASGQFRIPLVQTGSGTSSLIAPQSNSDGLRTGRPGQRIDLSPLADVCFTIRSYKVKPVERLRNNETGAAGYSTCEMGSSYRVRSADGPSLK